MRAAAAVLFLSACGGAPFLGHWRFSAGEASVSCDGGTNPASYLLGPFTVARDPSGELVTDYVSGCPITLHADGESASAIAEQTCDARLQPGDGGVQPSVTAVQHIEALSFTLRGAALEVRYRARVESAPATCHESASGTSF